jgi:hypothetical protein
LIGGRPLPGPLRAAGIEPGGTTTGEQAADDFAEQLGRDVPAECACGDRLRSSLYRPGTRSRAWWKAKHKLSLEVEILHCAEELIRWGDWGWACVLAFAYRDPRRGELVTVEQAVRVARAKTWTPRLGPATILCWGIFPSGLLRHPVVVS